MKSQNNVQEKKLKKKSSNPNSKSNIEQKIFVDEEPLSFRYSHNENTREKSRTKKDLRVSPSARKLATEKNIDLQKLKELGKMALF